jgi:hypothetical protein
MANLLNLGSKNENKRSLKKEEKEKLKQSKM